MANDQQKRMQKAIKRWACGPKSDRDKSGKKAGTPRPGFGVRTNVGDPANK